MNWKGFGTQSVQSIQTTASWLGQKSDKIKEAEIHVKYCQGQQYTVFFKNLWKHATGPTEKTNNFPCPEENFALGIQLCSLVTKCSSTETAHVLNYEVWSQSWDNHYWCQRSQKMMPVMSVGRKKISVSSLYLDTLWGTKESAKRSKFQKNITETFKRRWGSQGKEARMQSNILIPWVCPW